MHFFFLCEKGVHMCHCKWVCVYKTAGRLIVAAHLPHISTLSLCTCLLSYVHCGFSTSPAIRSQPQIRAIYLTTVASSSAYKHTPSLSLSASLLFSHVDATINAATLNNLVLSCCCCANTFLPEHRLRRAKDWWCLWWWCANTPKYKHLQAFTHTHRHMLHACTDKHLKQLQETNTHVQRERCMSGILLHNCPTPAVWHGNIYFIIQSCKKSNYSYS